MDLNLDTTTPDQAALEAYENFPFYSEERKLALLSELRLLIEHYRGMQEIHDEHLALDDEGRWIVDDLGLTLTGALVHLLANQ